MKFREQDGRDHDWDHPKLATASQLSSFLSSGKAALSSTDPAISAAPATMPSTACIGLPPCYLECARPSATGAHSRRLWFVRTLAGVSPVAAQLGGPLNGILLAEQALAAAARANTHPSPEKDQSCDLRHGSPCGRPLHASQQAPVSGADQYGGRGKPHSFSIHSDNPTWVVELWKLKQRDICRLVLDGQRRAMCGCGEEHAGLGRPDRDLSGAGGENRGLVGWIGRFGTAPEGDRRPPGSIVLRSPYFCASADLLEFLLPRSSAGC